MNFGDMVTPVIVVIGWAVLFAQSIHMKRYSDVKIFVDEAKKVITEIDELSIQYFAQGTGHINFESSEIRARFVALSHYLLMIDSHFKSKKFSPLLVAFKKCVTGFHFETTEYQKQTDIPGWLLERSSASNELRFVIDREFYKWTFNMSVMKIIFSRPKSQIIR